MEKQFICSSCGHIGKPTEKLRGNFPTAFVLWWLFIIPGIVYSIWRRSDKNKFCQNCNNQTLIPANSPMGQKLLNDTGQKLPEVKEEKKSRKTKIILGIIIFYVLFMIIGIIFSGI